ncbi:MAG: GntR family transcriptional regulator [Sedimentibacter saalensis]|uniref:GntR family transcriptional regulator n=1 Tax=Sedimentibacter saalensis TaxID=130788 RepID=A0A562JKZ6_9FIRM|nr:GntR family transcriptional regulator [Sedimentibacter saalensis]MEA5096003.1 GntR family transcriptional regulator [Sedimentibacter saalensis]TWH83901.1 GntR family transcriptional regulator [Sedimentibacter saalensis]
MIKIDNNSSKAIYEQIYDEMTRLILSKALKPDEKMPSVRELAAMIKINPNTIQKAYKSLEEYNYIYTVKGKGNFVKNADEIRSVHIKTMEEQLNSTIRSLKELGLEDEEVIRLVKNILNEGNK